MKEGVRWLAVLALPVASGCAQLGTQSPVTAPTGQVVRSPALAGTQPLFIITCNKNADIVHYDAQLTADGTLYTKEPVIVYWAILAQGGRRKDLNWIQKTMAYGINIVRDPSVNGYQMNIVAAPQRSITVRKVGSTVRAEIVIDGRSAVLEKIYIAASNGPIWPTVQYLELYGKDVQTAENRFEKIMPR